MDESAHPTQPELEPPTPEIAQLLKVLDLEAAAQRERRGALPPVLKGASFRYGSLIAIVVFTFGSIAMMEWMISQLPKPAHRAAAPAASATPSGGAHNGQ